MANGKKKNIVVRSVNLEFNKFIVCFMCFACELKKLQIIATANISFSIFNLETKSKTLHRLQKLIQKKRRNKIKSFVSNH